MFSTLCHCQTASVWFALCNLTMDRLTNEQRLQIIEFYYQNSCSVRNVHRALLPFYGRHSRPSEQSIRKIVTKFRTKFTLLDIKPPTRLRAVRSEEKIAAVSASVTEDREMSIRRRSQQLGLCYSTTWKILRKDLGMGKPALYYATLSPPSRAVMLTAAALGIELELRPINLLKGEHLTPEFIKMNPQHTIPTLDDNGVIIYDSHAICAYLVGKYGTDDKLYPKDLVKRANVDARLHLDSGHLFARLRMLYEPILYYGSTDCSIDKIAYIQKCWDILENFLKEDPYLCGDELTIADLCCIATITSVNEVAPINETKYPKLMAWMERMSELPYYKSTNEEGAEELKKLFKEKLSENKSKK